MTYDEALAYWYGRINYEVKSARPGDLKLERMQSLLRRLGDPHDRLPIVHVTGTKGKGSTSAMIAFALRCSGYRVGLFTSPHLTAVEERIQVDGEPIAPADLAALMAEVAAATREIEADRRLPGLTFFEIGTALGFLHFVRRRCDIAVVEVGLGGRFDSTNVCTPLVSVITNVGFDHMAVLGNSLEEIAFEKAGIIKRGVPVVLGAMPEGPATVIRRVAAEKSAPVYEARAEQLDAGLRIGLLGAHQRENAACAVAALERLRQWSLLAPRAEREDHTTPREVRFAIPDAALRESLATVRWPARIEVVAREPTVILDGAHNVPSVQALVRTLVESFPLADRKSVVFAVSSDKQSVEMLRILAGYFDEFHLTKYGDNPRCVEPSQLAAILAGIAPNRSATVHASSSAAWQAARANAKPDDLLCVAGSVFLAGELRPILIGDWGAIPERILTP